MKRIVCRTMIFCLCALLCACAPKSVTPSPPSPPPPVEPSEPTPTLTDDSVEVVLRQSEHGSVTIRNPQETYKPRDILSFDIIPAEAYAFEGWDMTISYTDGSVLKDSNSVSPDIELFDYWKKVELRPRFTDDTRPPLPIRIESVGGGGGTVESVWDVYPRSSELMYCKITPDDNSYIMTYYTHCYDGLPYESGIFADCFLADEYKGTTGVFDFADDMPEYAQKEIVVFFIAKEQASVLRFVFDRDSLERTDALYLNEYGTPSPALISPHTVVVQKNTTYAYAFTWWNNLKAVYQNNYQFAGWKDESGQLVTPHLEGYVPTDRDQTFTMTFTDKPILDDLFDYTLTDDGAGYLLSINQSVFYYDIPMTELYAPATYNGKPVVGALPEGFVVAQDGRYLDYSHRVIWP